MKVKNYKKILAAVASAAMLAGYAAPLSSVMNVSAGSQLLDETSFNHKALPWHTYEANPAKQTFSLDDGTFHIYVLESEGADKEKWDLQFRHRNLNFKKGHTYKISFRVKASRDGIELDSNIGNIKGDEQYVVLNGSKIEQGPHMGGQWGTPAKLTTDWQKFEGEFISTADLENAQWVFNYAYGMTYGGNTKDGDQLWFDDMSVECMTDNPDGECSGRTDRYYYVNRDTAAAVTGSEFTPYISVNQLGYLPGLQKTAVLGDNKGDITEYSTYIDLTEDSYEFEVCDSKTGETVYKGVSDKKITDADSGDSVCKLDFSELRTEGQYYIRVGEWRSFDFRISSDIYSDSSMLLTNALNYFYQNRAGSVVESGYITSGDKAMLAHAKYDGSLDNASRVQKTWQHSYSSDRQGLDNSSSSVNVNGGWYEAENISKFVVNGAASVWTLQNMYELGLSDGTSEKFKDGSSVIVIPETENDIPDILDEAEYELKWMSEMVVREDEPEWGEYAGLVYHGVQDCQPDVPRSHLDYECDDIIRIVHPPTFAATLSYAACAAQAARLWEPYDSDKAQDYLDKAKASYEAYKKFFYEADMTEASGINGEITVGEALNERSLYAPATRTESYSDYDVSDDAYRAACELYVSAVKLGDTDADKYYDEITEYKDAFGMPADTCGEDNTERSPSAFSWKNTAAAGTMTLLLNADTLKEADAEAVKASVTDAACMYTDAEKAQGYGIPHINEPSYSYSSMTPGYANGGCRFASNSAVINNAVVMAYAYRETGDVKFLNGVSSAMDYLLGTNPLSVSYITGYGSYYAENPAHRFWQNELDKTLPKAPSGVLVSGPNANADHYMYALGFNSESSDSSQRYYADSVNAVSVNSASAEYNASLAWVVSFLQDTQADKDPADSGSTEGGSSSGSSDIGNGGSENPSGDKYSILYGDVDADGKIDLSDLTMLSQYVLRDVMIEGDQLKAADCNGDGSVAINDLALLKQYVMKDKVKLGPV